MEIDKIPLDEISKYAYGGRYLKRILATLILISSCIVIFIGIIKLLPDLNWKAALVSWLSQSTPVTSQQQSTPLQTQQQKQEEPAQNTRPKAVRSKVSSKYDVDVTGNNNKIYFNEINGGTNTFNQQSDFQNRNTTANSQVADSPNQSVTQNNIPSQTTLTSFHWRLVDRSNQPIAGATISIPEYDVAATTNHNGFATLNFIPNQMLPNEKFHIYVTKPNEQPVAIYAENETSQQILLW